MSTARLHFTYDDYLSIEAKSPVKHDFAGGEIFAMAGGTPEHAALAGRLASLLAQQFPKCVVFPSDLRLRLGASDMTTYPDASVVCGKVSRSAEDPLAITNPSLVVEVTSPSTEEYDRGKKLAAYQKLASLETVLIVSHRSPRITVWRRKKSRWASAEVGRGQSVKLGDAEIPVDAVFSVLDALR